MQQNQLLLGLRPEPAGELTVLPRSPSWWGGGSLPPLPKNPTFRSRLSGSYLTLTRPPLINANHFDQCWSPICSQNELKFANVCNERSVLEQLLGTVQTRGRQRQRLQLRLLYVRQRRREGRSSANVRADDTQHQRSPSSDGYALLSS